MSQRASVSVLCIVPTSVTATVTSVITETKPWINLGMTAI